MWKQLAALAAGTATLAACGYVDRYEEHVYEWEPTYCYQSIGGVECFREPYHRDGRRLVNYFGPHPSRYDPPPSPDRAALQPPPETDRWVKDPEPEVEPAVRLTYADVYPASAALEPLAPGETTPGTVALLRRIEDELAAAAMRPFEPVSPVIVGDRVPATEGTDAAAGEATQPPPQAVPLTPVEAASPQ